MVYEPFSTQYLPRQFVFKVIVNFIILFIVYGKTKTQIILHPFLS